ncbi:hypothetical protein DESC_870005 [Desulfosarcina cetonica]|nr:hypothetical protein DESC_870005 [Desulfosarcina cetonica]
MFGNPGDYRVCSIVLIQCIGRRADAAIGYCNQTNRSIVKTGDRSTVSQVRANYRWGIVNLPFQTGYKSRDKFQ